MESFFFARVAFASVDSFMAKITELIINPLIVLLFALAAAYFLYGVFQFVANAENEEKKTQGKKHMLYGVLGTVIMMGVFSILQIIVSTFGLDKAQRGKVIIDSGQGSIKIDIPKK